MATNSNRKRDTIAFVSIGFMFITLGVTAVGSWLFIPSGVLFMVSAFSIYYRDKKYRKEKQSD